MIFADFAKALGQLFDRRFRRVLVLGILLSVALLVAGYAGILWLVQWLDPAQIALPFVGKITWLTDLLGWASLAFVAVLSIFLMVPVASAITALFLDDVAQAVEDKHYPHLPPAGRVGFYEGLFETVNFLGLLIGANILALVLAGFLPLAYPFVFYLLNGFLLGREYFMIAALRREGPEGAKALRRANAGQIWLAGCLMALPLTIPFVNLVIPVLGAATFTHLYHRLAGTNR
jgi:CysZ protein